MPVTVVSGPPCSGKSTYVREHAKPGDVVIDFDVIAQALGSPADHGHGETLQTITAKARAAAINEACKRSTDVDVWIVESCPAAYRVEQYNRYGAQWIRLDVPVDELHRRADAANRPADWHRYIDEWAPTKEQAGPAWNTPWPEARKQWRPRPDYRAATGTWKYQQARRRFLAGKHQCEACGKPFVTDAMCTHPSCRRRGKGCVFHPQYPTVQHMIPIADAGDAASLDTSTWAAWCGSCNSSHGGRYSGVRRAQAKAQQDQTVSLNW